jgi:hypothetical protein
MHSDRHLIGCHLTQETKVQNASDDAESSIHLKDSARHVIGCHLNQETRVQYAFDDVAGTVHQSLGGGRDARHD